MSRGDDQYDVVLWGATGFTGQRVADYLADRYDPCELDWAIAGRSTPKLAAIRDRLADRHSAWDTIDVLTGDARGRESLAAIADRTRVVCSTVGPFADLGSTLVETCVETGTHYCDLAGEIHWIRRMIDEHHERAREAGVRIVHACGFDAVPSDLGTLLVQNRAMKRHGTPCTSVTAGVRSSSTQLSGGTYASIMGVYEAAGRSPSLRRIVGHPYSLAPEGERDGPDDGPQMGPAYDRALGQWSGPFVMATINEKVVRRSNALLGYPWGRDFRYREVTPTGSGITGAARAAVHSIGLGLFAGALSVSVLRRLMDRFVLPDSGEGPSQEVIENSRFEIRLVGTGTRPDGGDDITVEGRVAADQDPGYGATAWMLGESAVCLAEGATDTPLEGGVLTPASGIGRPLINRLDDRMHFSVR